MKRVLAILLAAITALLCACGGGTAPETTAAPTTAPTTEATTEPTVPAEDILAEAEALLFPGGLDTVPDGEAALALVLPLAEAGNAHAQYLAGYIYDYSVGVAQDYEEARKWYTLAADQGYPRAMVGLFYLYYYGQGVEADEEKAEALLQQALDMGYVEANYALADLTDSLKDELECYFAGAEGSDPEFVRLCYLAIGEFYHYGAESYDEDWGYGEVPNYPMAMAYYQQAADLGEPWTACKMAALYSEGLGVEKNPTKAVEILEEAAPLMNSCTLYDLGMAFYYGDGTGQDYEKAMEAFLKSVEANGDGSQWAMQCIGWLYEKGLGVEQDYQAATDWYKKAIEAGNEYAEEDLTRMKAKGYS